MNIHVKQVQAHSAKNMIIRQIVVGAACLGAGVIVIMATFPWWIDLSISLYGDDPSFLDVILWFSVLLLLIVAVTEVQSQQAMSSSQVFKTSTKYAFQIGIVVAGLHLVARLLSSSPLGASLLGMIPHLTLSVLLGGVVGALQAFGLEVEGFDSDEHLWLLGNEASVENCRASVLPYREQVSYCEGTLSLILMAALPVGYLALIWKSLARPWIAMIIIGGLGALQVAAVAFTARLLISPRITFVEGRVSKSREFPPGQSRKGICNVTCQGRQFNIDCQVWKDIKEKNKYRIWYSAVNKKMMAFEEF